MLITMTGSTASPAGPMAPRAHITLLAIYNNLFEGPVGADITSHIFLEGGTGSGSTPCGDSTSGIAVYNNVALADQPIPTGIFGLFSGNFTSAHGGGVYNNTIISSDSTSDSSNVCFAANSDVSGMTFENNSVSGCNQLVAVTSSIGFSPNYNQYGNGGSNAFVCLSSFDSPTQFASWQSCISGDANSKYSASLNMNGSGVPQSGSPLINAGTNLMSMSTGSMAPLGSDKAGNVRPSTGAWTVGAYSTSGPMPPTVLNGTVQTK